MTVTDKSLPASSDGERRIDPDSPEWPTEAFAALPDPTSAPRELFAVGDLTLLTTQTVCVVGTGAPTGYGATQASAIGQSLAERGFTLVIRSRFGIDANAARAALGAGGKVIPVLAHGTDVVHPHRLEELYQDVWANGGLLVSRYPRGTSPTREQQLERNRLAAVLSGAGVLIEPRLRSGALGVAHTLDDCGRNVFVVPGDMTCHRSRPGHELVADGVAVLLAEPNSITIDPDVREVHVVVPPDPTRDVAVFRDRGQAERFNDTHEEPRDVERLIVCSGPVGERMIAQRIQDDE